MRPGRRGWAAAGVILMVLALLWERQPAKPLSIFDQPFYLGIAHDLLHAGRFTDGFMFAQAGADGQLPSGMRFAPLYPGLVAAAAELDGGLRRGMECVVATRDADSTCPSHAASIRGLQFLELCGFYWMVWWMAGVVGGAAIAWVALLLGLVAAPLLGSVEMVMTETTCLTLSTGAMAAAVAALHAKAGRRLWWSVAAGLVLGLTVLTRPGFLYVALSSLVAVLVLGRRRALPAAAAFGLTLVGTLAPWLVRNWVVLGQLGMTRYYDSHTLVQRIAFDTMDWREYGMAYVCWLPDGRALGRGLAGPHGCDRFGWDDPNSFYLLGLRRMLPETLAASGGYAHHLGYLLGHYVFRMPVKHLLVSIPLALRGAYVAHWWGFVLLPAALAATWLALRGAGRFAERPFLVMALPAWFMLAFNAAVAVNQVRYNLLLVPVYSVSGALGLQWLWRRAGAPASGLASWRRLGQQS